MSQQQIAALRERARANFSPGYQISSPPRLPNPQAMCICDRKVQDILCKSCGYIFVGRVRKPCMEHPNQILLMDSERCPKCTTDSLMEIQASHCGDKNNNKEINEFDDLFKPVTPEPVSPGPHMRQTFSPWGMMPDKNSYKMRIPSSTDRQRKSFLSPESIRNQPKMTYRE
ncbi:hypothetical protein ACF0H5_016745 [Mactra antiquata]